MNDPEQRALLYVQQYLQELGYKEALAAVEREAGLLYDVEKCQRGGQLMQMVYDELEEEAAAHEDTDAAARHLDEHLLLYGTPEGPSQPLGGGAASSTLGPATVPLQHITDLHASNVLVVRFVRGTGLLLTGCADGSVQLIRFATADVLWSSRVGSGGVLALDLRPQVETTGCGGAAKGDTSNSQQQASWTGEQQEQEQQQRPAPVPCDALVAAAGSMDGSVSILSVTTGRVLASHKPHRKYVVRLAWSPDGATLVTASYDQTLALTRIQGAFCNHTSAAAPGLDQEDVHSSSSSSSSDAANPAQAAEASGWQRVLLQVVFTADLGAAVQDVTFLRPGDPSSSNGTAADAAGTGAANCCAASVRAAGSSADAAEGFVLLAAVRDTNYLRRFAVRAAGGAAAARPADAASSAVNGAPTPTAAAAAAVELAPVNLNEAGDSHVSFSALRLAVSPCGHFLLVATDGPRLLLLRARDFSHARALHGLPHERFHLPAVAWHRDARYVYACAAGGAVLVYGTAGAKVAARLEGLHKVNVRDVDYDPALGMLATCSFDRSVWVYGARAGDG